MSNNTKFEAHDKTIRDVLFSNYAYQIPRYQRYYTWDSDQVTEFLNDLVSGDEANFLGSLIFNREPYTKTGLIDIIDGQQRLLTITIFCAVLRNIMKTIELNTAYHYQRHDIEVEHWTTGKSTYRITPAEQTREFFEKNIQQFDSDILTCDTQNPEQQRIKRNYKFFHDRIRDELRKYYNKSDQVVYINSLREKIANLIIISIEINNEDEAYEIFETTNARGVDLSVADLLKNLIFKKLPPAEDKDFAKEIWGDTMDAIEQTNTEMKRFLRYYWISRHSPVTDKKLFREIKRETVDYKVLLEDIWESADLYNLIVEGSQNEWDNIKHGRKLYKSIEAIRIMDVSQCYILFLSILRNMNKIGTDPTRIFDIVEKFAFQYSIVCKLPTNRIENIYAQSAKKIQDIVDSQGVNNNISGKIQSAFSALQKELVAEMPTPEYFISQFESICYRNSEQHRRLIKYILSKIDSYYRETKEESIDFDNVNIEHLLPQTPDKAWNLSKQEIKNYVNKLGNLTLIDKRINSKAGNKIIKEKIETLELSKLPITRKLVDELIANNYCWDEDCIIKRQKELAQIAYDNIWNI